MQSENFIAIIIVNYNGENELLHCLESLSHLEHCEYSVAVIDNGSLPTCVDRIRAFLEAQSQTLGWKHQVVEASPYSTLEKWNLILSKRNLGFSGGNNLGIRFFRSHRPKGYWFLNPDTIADKDSLAILANEAERPGVAIVGSTLLEYGTQIVQDVGVSFQIKSTRSHALAAGKSATDLPSKTNVEKQITYASGASFYIASRIMDLLAFFDERYFLYFEELDLAERTKDLGSIAWAPSAKIWHLEGASIGSNRHGRPSDFSIKHFHTSMLKFYWKWHCMLISIAFSRCIYNFLRYCLAGDFLAAKAILSGVTGFFLRKR